MNPEPSAYRPDIDGLRALAVAAVVLFHAFPKWVPGGFVGVDVFFVISGYLITLILMRAKQAGGISILDFYKRRIRRIFPALSLVLIFCIVYGWSDLLTDELVNLGRHVAAGVTFTSNWLLHREAVRQGGYFETASELKPLLHLWSLGVEEQFYIFWPPLCLLSWRLHWPIRRLALILGGLSFVLNLALLPFFKDATFYLPFTRLWEILAGCALASTALPILSHKNKQLLAAIGLGLIMIAIVTFNRAQPFPGWRALLPVIGTIALIVSGETSWMNRAVLSHPLAVGLGLISFPLYLWHWPLMYFARLDTEFTTATRIYVILFALGLSILTYQFVEKRLRNATFVAGIRVVPALMLAMILVGVVGKVFVEVKPRGLIYRYAVANQDLSTLELDHDIDLFANRECLISSEKKVNATYCNSDLRAMPTGVVLGDSRAHAIYSGLVTTSTPDLRWAMISRPSCGPFLDLNLPNKIGDREAAACQQLNTAEIQALSEHGQIKTVLIAVAARTISRAIDQIGGPKKDGERQVLESLSKTITSLQRQGKEVTFLLDNPSLVNPLLCVQRSWKRFSKMTPSRCGIPRMQHDSAYVDYYEFVKRLRAEVSDVAFFDPTNRLCIGEFCSMTSGGKFLYSDKDHYSDYGAQMVAAELAKFRYQLRRDKGFAERQIGMKSIK